MPDAPTLTPAAGAMQAASMANRLGDPTPVAERPLHPPNVLLLGDSGTGKTYCIGTLVDWCAGNGKEVFYLDLNNSLETLLGFWRDKGKEIPECLHWHQFDAPTLGLQALINGAVAVGNMSYENLTKMIDPTRGGDNNAYWKILSSLMDFPDDRTGKKFGNIGLWDENRYLVLDSFTDMSVAAAKMTIGNKPTMAPPEYGVAQNNLMNWLRFVTQGCRFGFVMTAHPSRDKDEISGQIKTQVKTVGTAIQSDIPPLFSDAIWVTREVDQFHWDTAAYGVTTKTRSLGYRQKIPPDFKEIMNLWKKRGGK